MAENKTVPTGLSVDDYINAIENPQRKEDCLAILELMKNLTGMEPKMWGTSIIGFGTYHYKYDSGREGEMLCTGFSNRKQAITIYLMDKFERKEELLDQVGKYKRGKSCFYIKKLDDIDFEVLSTLILESYKAVRANYTVVE